MAPIGQYSVADHVSGVQVQLLASDPYDAITRAVEFFRERGFEIRPYNDWHTGRHYRIEVVEFP